jgi:hypothetical protein
VGDEVHRERTTALSLAVIAMADRGGDEIAGQLEGDGTTQTMCCPAWLVRCPEVFRPGSSDRGSPDTPGSQENLVQAPGCRKTSGQERIGAIHDALAVCAIIDPTNVTTAFIPIDIEVNAGPSVGRIVCDFRTRPDKPANVHFAVDADAPKFVQMLLDILGCPA